MPSTSSPLPTFALDVKRRIASLDGAAVKMSSRAFDLLAALYARRGELVTKDELIDIVWPDVIVEENNLHVHVSAIRRAFGRDALVTIPGRGYQWVYGEKSIGDFALTSFSTGQSGEKIVDQQIYKNALCPALIGRTREELELDSLLNEARFIVISGAGGIGKTSLAREVVASRKEPIYWIDLTAVERDEQIPALTAKAASAAISVERSSREQILDALASKSGIFIFDNCEHVLYAAQSWIVSLLNASPSAKVLATTQEPLHHPAAKTYRLDALHTPSQNATPSQIRESAAVELLLARARAENHRFALADEDLQLAASLCRALDGMPLAIEMAAVRLPSLGLRGLHERLTDRIQLFRSKYANVPARQQTLRGAFDWSFSLLETREQQLLLILSEFVGGFRLEAAQYVAEAAGVHENDALDALDQLIERSFVRLVSSEPLRYQIPETARLYAQERLLEQGRKPHASHAHAQAMMRIATEQQARLTEINDEPWLQALFPDYENMSLALTFGDANKRAPIIAATAQSLLSMDDVRMVASANMRERIRIAHEACAYADAPTRALLMNSVATTPLITDLALSRKEAAKLRVEAWQTQNDPEQLGYAWARYAYNCASQGDLQAARAALAHCEAMNASAFSPRTQLRITRLNISIAGYLGDAKTQLKYARQAVAMCELAGSKPRLARAVMELGDALFNADQFADAALQGERAISLLEYSQARRTLMIAHANTVAAHCFLENVERARSLSLVLLTPPISAGLLEMQSDAIALALAQMNAHEDALRCVGIGDAWYRAVGFVRESSEAKIMRRTLDICAQKLDSQTLVSLRAEGESTAPETGYALAIKALRAA